MRFGVAVIISASLALTVQSALSAISSNSPAGVERAAANVDASARSSPASYLPQYTAPSAFPTSAFSSFYQAPDGTTVEPRPAITNEVKGGKGGYFEDKVAEPFFLPTGAPANEAVYPKPTGLPSGAPKLSPADYASQIQGNISTILNSTDSTYSNCTRCLDSLALGQKLAKSYPEEVPNVLIDLCKTYRGKDAASRLQCERQYAPPTLGASYSQVLSYADVTSANSTDGGYICNLILNGACPLPSTRQLTDDYLKRWFGKAGRTTPEWVQKRGQLEAVVNDKIPLHLRPALERVAHLSDIHIDPRYLIASEAACTNGQCCRADSFNASLVSTPPNASFTTDGNVQFTLAPQNISDPAIYWGAYKCDAPWSLVASVMSSVEEVIVTNTREYRKRSFSKRSKSDKLSFSLFTGDMVTHDASWHLSRELTWYTQQSIFDLMHRWLGAGPVYSAIGNHDTAPSDFAAPSSLPDGRGDQFSWDWLNVARLFKKEGWITSPEDLKEVRTHYAGYSVKHGKHLRVITLNTDMWYKGNIYNFISSQNPDHSGMLRFLTDELFEAERKNERVWIIGHVLSGWSGTNGLDNPTNLFYQIVSRFAPYTIKAVFFGHTHEDQFSVFYNQNGTTRAARDAISQAFIGPSVTPLTNVNPSFRIYDVDPLSYDVVDYHQYYAQTDGFKTLPSSGHGPVWTELYSARETYGNFTASRANGTYTAPVALSSDGLWPESAPLNGTFWAAVTDEMTARPELVALHTRYSGRVSPRSPTCTSPECVAAKICYMRAGSSPLGKLCPRGFDSVQSGNYH